MLFISDINDLLEFSQRLKISKIMKYLAQRASINLKEDSPITRTSGSSLTLNKP